MGKNLVILTILFLVGACESRSDKLREIREQNLNLSGSSSQAEERSQAECESQTDGSIAPCDRKKKKVEESHDESSNTD